MAFTIWFVLCVVCGWVIFADACCWRFTYRIKHFAYRRMAGCGLGFAFLAIAISPLYYEFPNYWFSKVVTFEGDRVIEHPFGTFAGEFGEAYSNVPTVNTKIASSVPLLTDGPKIRTLRYTIRAQITNPEAFFRKKQRRHHSAFNGMRSGGTPDTKDFSPTRSITAVEDEIEYLVACQMLEFNNLFSKQLAQLYNPLTENQQEAFSALIEGYFNAALKQDGIAVRTSPFTIK